MTGWLKLHRKIVEHPRFRDGDWLKVWLWMLSEAAFEPRRVLWQGKPYELQPGEFTAGRKQIAAKTGVSESKVTRIIAWLKSEHQIEQQASNKYSLFSVLKWEAYQQTEQPIEQPPNSHRTATEQPPNTPKECKEVQEVKKGRGRPQSVEEIRLFAAKSGLPDLAQDFWDYFESNGWKVGGRAAMKSWHAAYRRWCRNNDRNGVHQTAEHGEGYRNAW